MLDDPKPYGESRDGMFGASPAMRRVFAVIDRVATSSSTVLLEGETGVGKTKIARAIHQRSNRRDKPFVIVDCGAIPTNLIESELFGHEKGSFTGAHAPRPGAFENAHGGTVFLDEIGELTPDVQPKLLRVLDSREVKRLGAAAPTQLDVRLIAATNRDLREQVDQGRFRSDLYYRINTVRLDIPPLRERAEDIPLLVAHFYALFSDGALPPPELLESCLRESWPGNVRELKSAIERAVLLGDTGTHGQATTPGGAGPARPFGEFDGSLSYRQAKQLIVDRFERWYVTELLREHQGNLSRAARAARMDRNHLRELMRRHAAPPSK